jgi:predicted GNAT superfamily acetyltransferase
VAGSQAAPLIEYRPLAAIEDCEAAVEVQRKVWGFADIEIVPSRLFLLAKKIGGQAIGAFDGPQMAGFCLSIPGIKPGGASYLHSHMLGVLEPYRDKGVGRRLKLEQRKDAVARGICLIEWTFDPLELKNAFLNVERLGVIVRRYVLNQYGVTSSRLHGGMPTDRLVAEWILDSPRTEAILEGHPRAREVVSARIEIPTEIQELRRGDVRAALEIQKSVADQFLDAFAHGLAVTGFERLPGKGAYLLSPWE